MKNIIAIALLSTAIGSGAAYARRPARNKNNFIAQIHF